MKYGAEAVPYLIDELRGAGNEKSRDFQLSWFWMLERCGPEAAPAIPELVRVLSHDYYWYRQLAAQALGAIGPAAREAVPHLEKILENPEELPRVLAAAWSALRKIRQPVK